MRFIILVQASPQSEAGVPPAAPLLAAMAAFHAELARAGVLLDAAGLQPSAHGWRVHYGADGSRSVTDGPFTERKELVGGYTLIEVRSRAEALEWTRRFPAPHAGIDCHIEVRPLLSSDDVAPGAAAAHIRDLHA